jgi:NTP pyrophosphatase (non-canonical NTP hydrolase)
VQDIADMHRHYGANEAVAKLGPEGLRALLDFRVRFLDEEMGELHENVERFDADEVVDALIDLVVVAIGTLDLFGVDSHESWERVLRANMAKEVGVKATRPNPLGLPDLVKPQGWSAPSHVGNHGTLDSITETLHNV